MKHSSRGTTCVITIAPPLDGGSLLLLQVVVERTDPIHQQCHRVYVAARGYHRRFQGNEDCHQMHYGNHTLFLVLPYGQTLQSTQCELYLLKWPVKANRYDHLQLKA